MGRHRAITPLDSPAPSSHAPPKALKCPQLCTSLLPPVSALVSREWSGHRGRQRYPEGWQAQGAMVVVSTGAEQTVPIRINPHPSC